MNVIVSVIWPLLRSHWRSVGLVLGSGILSGWVVHHYFPRVVSVPGPERVVTQTIEVKGECHAESEVKYVYQTVHVPGPSPACPDQAVLVPVPQIVAGGTATTTGGGSSTSTDTPPVLPSAQHSDAPRRWRAYGLAGVARTGTQVGGGVSYDLFGPVDVGVQVTVPTKSPADLAIGATLGLRF